MQNAAFRSVGVDWQYLDFRVAPSQLEAAVRAARTLEFSGLNLTIPHKVAVVPLLDDLEASAEICGAVNTVRRDPDGRFVGLNTDGMGFLWALRDAGLAPDGLDVVLLGAGGAARAVAVELALAGAARIQVANRSSDRRDSLVALLRSRTRAAASGLEWTGRLRVPPCDVLVDCTPVGMGTGAAADEMVAVDLRGLAPATIACDLNPETSDSALLRTARALGHRTLGGLPMLARQGAAGFAAWTGLQAPLELMSAELESAVREMHARSSA